MPLLKVDLWEMIVDLCKDLAVMYTVITLFLQKYTAKSLDRRRQPFTLNGQGILFFCLIAASTMLMQIELIEAPGIRLDLRLAVLTLAGIYLGRVNSTVVALFTVVFRFLLGGVGSLWWIAGAFLYGPASFLISRLFPAGLLGVAVAALINVALFMGVLTILSRFTNMYDYYSPFVSPENFWRLTALEVLMIPLATVILDWALKNVLAFHRSYSALEEKANHDGMTGLVNHRRFQEVLTEIIAGATPQSPAAVLMVDIDHFKRYNDAFGHQQGDDLLREMAGVFTACVRADDIVARYGGEEFIIILPHTPAATALTVAQRLRETVAAHPFPGRERMSHGQITVSVGLATFPQDAADKNSLIAAADKALYAAKNAGRNKVRIYELALEVAQ